MKRLIPTFVVTAIAALAMAGCSNSSSPPATTVRTTKATTTTVPATTTVPLASAQSLLLTVDQLPSGWSVSQPTATPSASCYENPLNQVPSVSYATVQFAQGGVDPVLVEEVGAYASSTTAFARIKHTLDGCTSFTETANTLTVTGTLGAMSAPTYGDESTAYTASLSEASDDIALEQGIIMAKKGPYIVALALGDVGPVDTDQLEQFMTTALAKVP